MSTKTLGLSFLIGAKLGASYEATLGTAERRVKQFDQSIQELERGRGDIERFRALKRGARETEVQLGQARQEVRRLAQEMRQGGQATAGLERRFDAARKKAKGLKDKFSRQQSDLHRLRGELRGAGQDTGRLESSYRQLGAALDQVRAKQERLGRITAEQERLRGKRAELKAQALDMVALGAALFAPVRSAMRFEEAMADVKKVVDFDEPDGLVKLAAALNAMPRKERIPLKPEELAAIATAGGQLGVAAQSLPGFTLTVAKMSTAFDMAAGDAGEAAAKVANVWGLPIERIGDLGDAINHLSDSTAAKAPEMLTVLQRIGGTARIFGLSAAQAAALGNAFVALGKTPEVASTGINAMLNRLMTADKQPKKFQRSLKQLGWTAKSLKQTLGEDAQGGLNKFLESLARADESKRMGILTDLFGMEFADDVSVLVSSLDQYHKAQDLVAQETNYAGSMQREFESRASTTTAQVRILGATLLELGNVLGNILLPPISTVANLMITMLGPVAEFAQQNETLTTVIVGLAAGLAVTRLATFSLGYAWTFVKGGALGLAKAVTLLTGRQALNQVAAEASTAATRRMGVAQAFAAGKTRMLGLATRSLGLALRGALMATGIGAVLVGLGLLIEHWDKVAAAGKWAWEGITRAAGVAWEGIKAFVANSPLGQMWEDLLPLREFFDGFWVRLKEDAEEAWGWIASKIGIVGDAIKKIPFVDKLFGGGKQAPALGAAVEPAGPSPKPELGKGLKNLPVGQSVEVAKASPDAIPISPAARPAGMGGDTITITVSPTVNIGQGNDTKSAREAVNQAMADSEQRIRKIVKDVLTEKRRLAYG